MREYKPDPNTANDFFSLYLGVPHDSREAWLEELVCLWRGVVKQNEKAIRKRAD